MTLHSLQNIAQALGGEVAGGQVLAPGPGHSPCDRSLSYRPAPGTPDGFVVHSFAGDDWIACKDHVRDRLGLQREFKRADAAPTGSYAPSATITRMADRVNKAKLGSLECSYDYLAADGTRYMLANRYRDPKDFRQLHWTGTDYAFGAPKGPKVPYRLPELIKAVHDTVFIVEGEKDADNLAARDFVATTNIGGASNWTSDLNEHFRGKRVFILPDNDEAGAKHAQKVATNLQRIASEVRILNLPGLPDKGDVSDWIAAGGDTSKLIAMAEGAPLWSANQDDSDKSSQENFDQDFGNSEASGGTQSAPPLIVSSAEFVGGFVPPDYLIDGLLQKRFCYSMTAPTGAGKTAVALLLSASIALGRAIGEYPVEQGRVLYLAGENPDDVRMRWLAMSDAMGFDHDTIAVHFLPGVFKLSEIEGRIRAEVEKIGPVALVVLDTSAAYFEGDEENANVQMGAHARRMRSLVTLPGEPCVLVACHPVKNAMRDNLLPRGGGAFTAEVDGNLTLWLTDSMTTMHWQGKFRGPDFAPLNFTLSSATTPRLKDSKGRLIPTVVAKPMSDKERSEAEAGTRGDEDDVLIHLIDNERASYPSIAMALGWLQKDGKPYKVRVQRAAKRLQAHKLVTTDRSGLTLTPKGKKEADLAKYNRAAAGAKYG